MLPLPLRLAVGGNNGLLLFVLADLVEGVELALVLLLLFSASFLERSDGGCGGFSRIVCFSRCCVASGLDMGGGGGGGGGG